MGRASSAMLKLLWTLLICGLRENNANPQYSQHHVSQLLDKLLDNYDNNLRPDLSGPAAVVDIDIMVRSMGPISEADMTYSMDCYFRQTWRDIRLSYQHNSSEPLALSISMLNRIWKPDTYFYNGKNSYVHTITTPNKLVRLFPNGTILYSSRLTIKASCPMRLENFPMDIQLCPLYIGSYAYTNRDVVYRWNMERQIVIAPDMKMSQFDLIATPVSNTTSVVRSGEFSVLIAQFHLERHIGNFLIHVYGPCVLLVVLSWVSFWLNREATADRVSLGVMTVLTMTFLGLEARSTLPKVPYLTALDYFIFLSFGFIFATIVQFAVVHYFTKHGYGETYFPNREEDSTKRNKLEVIDVLNADSHEATSYDVAINMQERRPSILGPWIGPTPPPLQKVDDIQLNSVSKIDRVSRIFFPLLFIAINLFYWYTFVPSYGEIVQH